MGLGAAKFAGGLFQDLPAAAADHQVGAQFAETPAHRQAQSGAAAGDQYPLARQKISLKHRASFPDDFVSRGSFSSLSPRWHHQANGTRLPPQKGNGKRGRIMAADGGFPDGVAYVDGDYRPMSEAKISVLDWGFLRSDATYDVVHVSKGKFFRLDKHIERFMQSVKKLRMTLPVDRDGLVEVLSQCVRRSGLRDAYVEMILTRGQSATFSRDPRDAVNNFIAFALPFGWIMNEEQRRRGINLVIAETRRIPAESVDPTVKNYHWLDLVAGMFEAYDRGGENVVLTDLAGNITEGPGFNIFAVHDGRAATAERGVLQGITRLTAIELCAELQMPVDIGTLSAEALRGADEVFLTSTAGGIMPVTCIDGEAIGDGKPGPATGRLTELYWARHDDPAWTTPVDYG